MIIYKKKTDNIEIVCILRKRKRDLHEYSKEKKKKR